MREVRAKEEQEIAKRKFDRMIVDSDFRSRRDLAIKMGISYSGLENNLSGRYGISVERLLDIANNLKVPVSDVLDVFYPEKYKENLQYGDK